MDESGAEGSKHAGDTPNSPVMKDGDNNCLNNPISHEQERPGNASGDNPQDQQSLATQGNMSDSTSTSCLSQPTEKACAENASQKLLTAFSFTDFFPESIPPKILSSPDELRERLTRAVDIQLHMSQYDTQLSKLDLSFPKTYAEDLDKDHSLLCHLAERVFCGLPKSVFQKTVKVIQTTEKVVQIAENAEKTATEKVIQETQEVIHTTKRVVQTIEKVVQTTEEVIFPSIDLKFVDEWNRTLDKMPFKAKVAIVPLTASDEAQFYKNLPLLIAALKPHVEQEITFEPLPNQKKLKLNAKAVKELFPAPPPEMHYGKLKRKDKQRKSLATAQSSSPKTSKSTTKRKERQQNVCTSDVKIHEALAGAATLSPYQHWGLEDIHRKYKGEETVIAIIDTGVNVFHLCFRTSWSPSNTRVIAAWDFVSNTPSCLVDNNGHGTHCASIACGQKFEGYTKNGEYYGTVPDGVAPEAQLISCKVTLDDSGNVDVDAVVRALRWLQNQKVDVVSISFGSLSFFKIADEIADLVKKGVIIVCAGCNYGHTVSYPICYPAALGNVICIGSSKAGGKPSDFSPVGQQMHFLAPGECILGADAESFSGVQIYSGTSCAAPAVAGLICLIIQCIRSNSSNKQISHELHNHWIVKEILCKMSTNSPIHYNESGYGALKPKPFFAKPVSILRDILDEFRPDLSHQISAPKKKKQ